jgi:hypothetical protein
MALGNSGFQWYNWPNAPVYHEFFDDFEKGGGTDATTLLTRGWDRDVDTGTTVMTTADGVGGVMTLATTAADNKWAQLQQENETFALTQGKKTWFTCRLQHSIALTDVWAVGLFLQDEAILDTTGAATGVAANMAVSDGVFFCSPEADAGVYGCVLRDSVLAVTGSISTMANATYKVLSFVVEMDASTAGKGTVKFYADGVEVGQISSTTMPYSAEETLSVAMALIARSATGSTLTVDYIGARQER